MSGNAGAPPPVIRRTTWQRVNGNKIAVPALCVVAAYGLYHAVGGSEAPVATFTTMSEPPPPVVPVHHEQAASPPSQALPVAQETNLAPQFPLAPPDAPPDPDTATTTSADDFAPTFQHFGTGGSVQPASAGAGAAAIQHGGVDYEATRLKGQQAFRVRDLAHTIKPGTTIPCILDVAMDGNLGGYFRCHTGADVIGWDMDPSHRLIPKGTQVMGTYQSLSTGERRLTALAAQAVLTDGVVVPLGGAPFTDDLGRMGVNGTVSNRFWERVGNAILTDAALMAVSLPQTALQSQGSGNFYPQTSTTNGVVDQVLQRTANLPPLFYKTQGETVAILVTQPIHVPF